MALILLTACSSFSDSEVKSKVSAELKNQFRHSRVISVEKVDEHDGIIRYEWVADYETLDGNFGIVTKIENQSTGYIDLYQNGDVADFRITSLAKTEHTHPLRTA